MISNILTRIFGSRNERLLKQYAPGRPRDQRARARRSPRSPTRSCAAKTGELKARVAGGATLEDVLPEAFAVVREAGKRALLMRHFDVQLHGRHGAALRQDRRNAHRRRQDARRHAAGVPQRARRQGRAHRHRQRLPRAARRRLDGPHLQVPRTHGRGQPVADAASPTSRPPTPPTSPTAPTTSSASTTCATTWCSRRASACSAA